jgi:superfamily I DNA and/or RNA helicase
MTNNNHHHNDNIFFLDKFLKYENADQKAARYRINRENTVPVTGPPGTGKSTVISHCCFDLLAENSPVLVTAPTNVMVNSILAKIDSLCKRARLPFLKGPIIRYGNTVDLEFSYPHLRNYTLDNIFIDSNEMNSFNKAEIARKYFQNAQIILTTTYSAKDLVKIMKVGAVIVDETGLVGLDTMAMLFSSLRHDSGKILVIGDDKQLPPASHDFIGYSLFSSILKQYETTLLKTEYRFNKDILDLINPNYQYKLKAHDSVKEISTADIAKKDYDGTSNNLIKILNHEKKIVFVDTNSNSQEQKHFINTGEISVVKELVGGLLSMGIDDIIITTPYKQQERMLQFHISNRNSTKIRVGTIDEFQGQESEVTIVSMVRSNNEADIEKAIGFVNIPRSCVAFSRSKRKTIIVGDQNTLIKSKFLSRSIDTVTRKDGFFIWRN